MHVEPSSRRDNPGNLIFVELRPCRARVVLISVVVGLTLTACGSTPTAAPPITSSVTVDHTVTMEQTATVTTTDTIAGPDVTVPGPTESIAGPTVTALKTVTKPAPPAVTKTMVSTVVRTPAAVTVTAEPPAAAGAFGEGTELVGSDIQPSTALRVANGAIGSALSGASGDLDDVIANDVSTVNPVVEIDSSDFAFTSHDCGTWTKIG